MITLLCCLVNSIGESYVDFNMVDITLIAVESILEALFVFWIVKDIIDKSKNKRKKAVKKPVTRVVHSSGEINQHKTKREIMANSERFKCISKFERENPYPDGTLRHRAWEEEHNKPLFKAV